MVAFTHQVDNQQVQYKCVFPHCSTHIRHWPMFLGYIFVCVSSQEDHFCYSSNWPEFRLCNCTMTRAPNPAIFWFLVIQILNYRLEFHK